MYPLAKTVVFQSQVSAFLFNVHSAWSSQLETTFLNFPGWRKTWAVKCDEHAVRPQGCLLQTKPLGWTSSHSLAGKCQQLKLSWEPFCENICMSIIISRTQLVFIRATELNCQLPLEILKNYFLGYGVGRVDGMSGSRSFVRLSPHIKSMTNIVVLPSTNCINFNFAFGDYGNDS
jgi:hypothetical protein